MGSEMNQLDAVKAELDAMRSISKNLDKNLEKLPADAKARVLAFVKDLLNKKS